MIYNMIPHKHYHVNSTEKTGSKLGPNFPAQPINKTSFLLFGVKQTLSREKINRNKAEISQVFAEVTGLMAFEKRQPVNLYKESTTKSPELHEGKRLAFFNCR